MRGVETELQWLGDVSKAQIQFCGATRSLCKSGDSGGLFWRAHDALHPLPRPG